MPGIVHIAGNDSVLRADYDARRFEPDIGPVGAVIALRGGLRFGMNVESVVRAGLGARLAADTPPVVEIDDTVLARVESLGRAYIHAGRVCTMVAAHHAEQPSRIGELAFFYVFDPGPVNADRHVVLGFAGDGARVATDAFAVVDDEAEVHLVGE